LSCHRFEEEYPTPQNWSDEPARVMKSLLLHSPALSGSHLFGLTLLLLLAFSQFFLSQDNPEPSSLFYETATTNCLLPSLPGRLGNTPYVCTSRLPAPFGTSLPSFKTFF
jgi:hypothetical protein